MKNDIRLHVETQEGERVIRVSPQEQHMELTELLRRNDVPLNTRCGQRGLCDGCIVELLDGVLIDTASGERAQHNGQVTELKACQYTLAEEAADVRLKVPPRSTLGHKPSVLSDFRVDIPVARMPLGDSDERPIGIAIDVGTTTVVVLAVRRTDGEILGKAAGFNRQMDYGDDVLTRINLCLTDPPMVSRLQTALTEDTIAPLIDEAIEQAGATADDIACVTAAGNTTMLHLYAGVNPGSLGYAPFTPVFLEHRELRDIEHSAKVTTGAAAEPAPLHLLPSAAAYIGADLTGGIFASGLAYDDGPSLLVDIGTNGEVIARFDQHLIGCATAAGPAFEGTKLACGMRATEGAISHVRVMDDSLTFELDVIGDGKPIGICGSAYIDLLAELRRVNVLLPTGRFNRDHASAQTGQMYPTECGYALRIVKGLGGRDITFTEPDVVSLLQAKAAIAAGIVTLLDRLNIGTSDIRTLNLAGGFGMHLDINNAIACGLLPDFEPSQIKLVGNTSLASAYLALLDRNVIGELSRIAQQLESIELNLEETFESNFIDQLMLV